MIDRLTHPPMTFLMFFQNVQHLSGSAKGFRDGSATNAKFHSPWGLTVYTTAGKKLALVSDYYNHRIRSVNVLSGWTSTGKNKQKS